MWVYTTGIFSAGLAYTPALASTRQRVRDQISLAHACIISACRLIKLRITGVGIFDGIEDRRFSALIFSGDQGEIFCNRNDRVGKSIPVDQLYIA